MKKESPHSTNKTEQAFTLLEALYSDLQPEAFEDELRMWYFDDNNRQQKDEALAAIFEREVNEVAIPDETAFEKLAQMFRHLGLPLPTRAIEEVRGISRTTKPTPKSRSLRFRWISGAAAVLLLLYCTIGLLVTQKSDTPEAIAQITVAADGDSIREVTLPDLSSVLLYPGGKLTYSERFTQSREATIQGKAFFKIMKDPNRKFTVQTDRMVIVVHGTEFMVKAHKGSDYSSILLYRGRVEIKAGKNESAILSPGEKLGYYASSESIVRTQTTLKEPTDPDLDFYMTNLEKIILTIGMYYQMTVEIVGNLPQDLKYTIDLTELKEVERALQLLAGTAQNFSYKIEDNTIKIEN